jgi:opacity protein-like surface antigen
MRSKHFLAAAAVAAYAVAPTQAHHAVQAQFDVNQTVEKKGILVKIDWINPHTYMHFDVTEEGAVTRYAIESLGVVGLRRAGIDSKSSFQVGGTFTFAINPSRNGSPTGLLVTLVFPDGRRFDVRNTDTGQAGGR